MQRAQASTERPGADIVLHWQRRSYFARGRQGLTSTASTPAAQIKRWLRTAAIAVAAVALTSGALWAYVQHNAPPPVVVDDDTFVAPTYALPVAPPPQPAVAITVEPARPEIHQAAAAPAPVEPDAPAAATTATAVQRATTTVTAPPAAAVIVPRVVAAPLGQTEPVAAADANPVTDQPDQQAATRRNRTPSPTRAAPQRQSSAGRSWTDGFFGQ